MTNALLIRMRGMMGKKRKQRLTLTKYPSSYSPSSVAVTNPTRGYTSANSSTYATVPNVNIPVTWLFDTSALPVDAEIISASLRCKCAPGGQNRSIDAMSGDVEKDTILNPSTSAATHTFDLSSWSAVELQNVGVRIKPGYCLFYGATLIIEYEI